MFNIFKKKEEKRLPITQIPTLARASCSCTQSSCVRNVIRLVYKFS
ncbi:hypothetical protein J2W48_002557 [Flavobacterium piscis]|uniref:Uncharacterized protein n=1 Tax=Flavobacterium piscis TaxID=1114874 RepID=A0ABU1Y8P6_9FLAO|nr:hypothetical protein [Flavobacterium piscis]